MVPRLEATARAQVVVIRNKLHRGGNAGENRTWWRSGSPESATIATFRRIISDSPRARRPAVSINWLESLGRLVTAGAMYSQKMNRPSEDGDPASLQMGNTPGVTWVKKRGGKRDHLASTFGERLFGRLGFINDG